MDGIETYREGKHTVRVVTERATFTKFRRRWNAALAEYPEASIYLTHQWLDALWAVYEDDIDGRVMMIDDTSGPCALAPFMGVKYRFSGLPIPAVGPLPAARTDVPLIRDQFECMDLLSNYTKRSGVQLWHLHNVPERSPMMQLLETDWDAGRRVERYETQDFPVIDTSTSWPEFIDLKPASFREECRDIQHSLEGIAIEPVSDAAALVAVMRRIRKRSGADAQTDFRREAFTEVMIREAGKAGTLRSMVAYDDRLVMRPAVGFAVGIEFNGTLHVLDTGCDAKYLTRAAGIGSFAELLWSSFESRTISRFDLSELSDEALEERSWATEVDRHISTLVLNGGVGLAAVKAGRVLDGFKRVFDVRRFAGKRGQDAAA